LDTLEGYLATEYLAQKQEIETIDRMLGYATVSFSEVFDGRQWPYEHWTRPNTGQTGPTRSLNVSQGTLSMVLTATGRLLGYCSLPKGTFAGLPVGDRRPLEANWKKGLTTLLSNLASTGKIGSSSFGENNPLTISHLAELWSLLEPAKFQNERKLLFKHLRTARAELDRRLAKDPSIEALLAPSKDNGRYYRNAFVPLRALRAATALDLIATPVKIRYRVFFESTLHDQLSFSSIPDSRFDPAELIFCLEGLLLCAPESIDSSLFHRVLEVLAEQQNTSAYWRPNKPFIASQTGSIMLPISVEGANSLMRSTDLMDANRLYDTFTAKSLPLIQRFWHWLRARSVRFDWKGKSCMGWHSEHVNDTNLIHIWDTSQVTEFMVSFREMLERHIATESLRLSRLSIKRLKPKPGEESWSAKTKAYEPMLGCDKSVQIYEQLASDFVNSWEAGAPENFSMLLYGPPGTGKSTIADNLAEVLDMPLTTVTVSDFLGAGGANVEARAKAIFQTLEAQDKCIILFDEIDSFFLDRDSKLYRDQDSLFQFLTPGMLTKVNDLRKFKRSIFIVATNYADRIDPAIKRTGRIDKQYLLPLPTRPIYDSFRPSSRAV
jgi:hypothetical protein